MSSKSQLDTEKDRSYSFASEPFTSRVMSTIILYDNLHPRGYIYLDLSPTHSACQKEKSVKRKGEDHQDSCIRVEDKSKDRPFAEGSRGCHALL